MGKMLLQNIMKLAIESGDPKKSLQRERLTDFYYYLLGYLYQLILNKVSTSIFERISVNFFGSLENLYNPLLKDG